jgi:hypothetical protein
VAQAVIAVILLIGLFRGCGYLIRRRIGGAGGGSEPEIVAVFWLVAALFTGIFLMR